MKKTLVNDLNVLSNGVQGLYISRKKKRKVSIIFISCVLIVSLFIISFCFLVPEENDNEEWSGRVIILMNSKMVYDNIFYTVLCPNLKNEFDMTKTSFEEKANISFYDANNPQTVVMLEALSGRTIKQEDLLLSSNLEFSFFVLDESDNILMEGTGEKSLIQCLKDSGFEGNNKESQREEN